MTQRRLLIVVDVYGWAWDRMAQGIQRYSPPDVEVTVLSQTDFSTLRSRMPWVLQQFDGISQCSWPESSTNLPKDARKTIWLASHGFEYRWPLSRTVAGLQSSRIATPNRNFEEALRVFPKFDRILCVSEAITRNLQKEFPSHISEKGCHTCPGVESDIFSFFELPSRKRLVVGWCGQRTGETKGYDTVFKRLRRCLGDVVDWQVNTRSAKDPLSQEEMVAWYRGLDLLISTSCSEGFQMPLLEAASCGRPVIATDVGAARELIQDDVSGYVVAAYEDRSTMETTVEQIRQKILQYEGDRSLHKQHGQAAREIVQQNFTWEKRAPVWLECML